MKKKSSKYSTPRGRANLTPGRKGKPPKPELVFHPAWETFCLQYTLTGKKRASAVRAGYCADYGFYLLKLPAIQARLAELKAEGDKATARILAAVVKKQVLHLEFVDEQAVDVVRFGEDSQGRGRGRMIEAAWRRLGAIQTGGNTTVTAQATAQAALIAGGTALQVYESGWLTRRKEAWNKQLEEKYGSNAEITTE